MDTYLGTLRAKLAAAPPIIAPGTKMNPMAILMQILGGGRYANAGFVKSMSQWAKQHPGWAIGSGLLGLQALRPMLGNLPIVGPMVGGNQR